MSRSFSYLCQGLLGIAFVGAMGFGATQAFAGPAASQGRRIDCSTSEGRTECYMACKQDGLVGYCTIEEGCLCEPM